MSIAFKIEITFKLFESHENGIAKTNNKIKYHLFKLLLIVYNVL